jgi:hypothetical protein
MHITLHYIWCVLALFSVKFDLIVGKRRPKSERNVEQSTKCLICLVLLVIFTFASHYIIVHIIFEIFEGLV